MSSQDNCVVFRFGEVIKGVNFNFDHDIGTGIIQHAATSCIILDGGLNTKNMPLVRTKSFSNLNLI